MSNTIKIKIHTTQFFKGRDLDKIETLEFFSATHANEYINNQVAKIVQKWRDMWGVNARIFQNIGYIECDVYGKPGIYEIFKIIEIDGVKVR